ncbi:hypothetical protein CBS101457_002786 [Exobasidium rhododendri]|nr:hypothetical protein CBS101457_002786 [Exobasidium rhododendri]
MAQSPLLRIPSKQTEEVDLAAAVGSLISNSYGQDAKSFKDQLNSLNRARQDAVQGAGSDTTARDLLYKWFHMLEMLELRFPELRVPFPWKDAFTSKPISQHSLAYEKASIIFNIAAVLSSIGAKTNRLTSGVSNTSASGTKLAYASLRQAAGMLSYINDNFLHAPSSDMSKDVVKWLVDIQLAQATEVFWERTLEDKKGGSLVARLAAQVTVMYVALADDVKEWATRGIFERSWGLLVQTKAKYFASVAQYHRALVDSTTGSHGACLVRLTLAETIAKEAQKVCLTFAGTNMTASKDKSESTLPLDAPASLKTIIDAHLALVALRKASAVKDNDLIYHDILPTESTLPVIEPLATAKPISIQEIYSSAEVQKLIGANTSGGAPSNDLFSSLVPLGVHEAASMYSEEKAKLVRGESERVALTDGQLQAALEYMTLPRGLKRYKSDGLQDLLDPGAEVRGWAEEEIQGGGSRGQDGLGSGSEAIDEGLRSVDSARERARGDLEEAKRTLDEEAAICEKLRVRYGDKWNQSPSGMETKSLRSDIKRNREALEQAAENDVAIRQLWNESEPLIRILLGGNESLDRAFAETVTSSRSSVNASSQLVDLLQDDEGGMESQSGALDANVASIESHLSMLQRIKKERTDSLAELRSRVQSDDISHLLILNRRASAESQTQLFQQELDKFRAITQRIARNVSDQEQVLGDLTLEWKGLNESNRGRSIGQEWEKKNSARERLISQLRRAKDSNAQVRAGLGKALSFYTELREIATALRRSSRSFSEERSIQRERLLSEVEWQSKGSSNNGGGDSLDSAFHRMNVGGGGNSRQSSLGPASTMNYRGSMSPTPSTPLAAAPLPPPPLTSYMHSAVQSSPYGDLDSAFGSSQAFRGPPPPPPTTSYTPSPLPSQQQYSSAPPPPPSSYNQYQSAPSPSHYSSPAAPPSSSLSNYHSSHQTPTPQSQNLQSSFPPPPPQWNVSYSQPSHLPPPPLSSLSQQSFQYPRQGYPAASRSGSGPPPPPLPNQQQQQQRQPSYSSYAPPPPAPPLPYQRQQQQQQQQQYSQPPPPQQPQQNRWQSPY